MARPNRVRVIRRSSTTFGSVLGGLLLLTGAILIPISMADTDKYDRTLAYARHDGLDVGSEQIAAGDARGYTYGGSFYG